ncbi:MAG: pyridoxamine 5'-phosphate oxidase family protein [Chloroflexi bacterium]|nr:pyridoxamine 5'-phosphate oxidase family protein [Chloroflexota bacterium]MDA1269658.1 pyridoxamine 5'-phosphate oxidase family protein [Chloroflexota bacterium]
MSNIYHEGNRSLQDRFDTHRLADRLDETIVRDTLTEHDKDFIESLDMFFMASVDDRGRVNCSYKGGEPGFVRVVDQYTVAFPNYDGNGMYLSMGNVVNTGQVGLLFIDFEDQWRMRLNGEATIDFDDQLLPDFPEAQFIVRVKAREVFPNCPRYIHRMKLEERSRFSPKPECATPVPSWKKESFVRDVLPAADAVHDESREVLDR